jgi:hypothetical protein
MNVNIRKEIIRLLKEDESFRYEVLGLLGLRELIEELRKLREDFNNFIKLSEKNGKRIISVGRRISKDGRRMIESG